MNMMSRPFEDLHEPENDLLTMYDFELDNVFYDLVNEKLLEKVAAYDPKGFSPLLMAHHKRVAEQAESFLIKFYPAHIARNIAKVFAWHDMGKILDNPDEWRVQKDKPNLGHLSPEELLARKARREAHTLNGPQVLDEAISEVLANLGQAEMTANQRKLIKLAKVVMLNHHERLDGSGPRSLTVKKQDIFIRIIAVIDTLDGKWKNGKPREQNIAEMANDPRFDRAVVLELAQHLGIQPAHHSRDLQI